VWAAPQEDQTLLAALEAVSEEALGGRNWQARGRCRSLPAPRALLPVRRTPSSYRAAPACATGKSTLVSLATERVARAHARNVCG
jgi:hypothetical protein